MLLLILAHDNWFFFILCRDVLVKNDCCDAGLLHLNRQQTDLHQYTIMEEFLMCRVPWGNMHIINRVMCILRRWDPKIQEFNFKHQDIYQVLSQKLLVLFHRLLHLQEV